ncbi:leucine-rich repeat flightless-interacting 2-like isoform X2 [Labeo rohita]|uniref:Leucine-rich repeat flightless-interacting 2-like isoform X2 n=1 Tax=Labeo rohita TaxID=84645 RepID=A0A498NJB2_LABRO|nr:leucine-rich repeat flightless-interacting 2-like isoform X2 [Labeo rohita]
MSEDESLRHIIRDSEDDLLSENTEMMEMRANYEDSLQEVRTLELQQETLLFQVDCLQDALESTEEMLAETQRENHTVTMELEREREMRRKLEDKVASLMQEVERLKEERNSEQLQSHHTGPVWLQGAPEGTSVDQDARPLADREGTSVDPNASPLLKLKKMVDQTLSQSVFHSQKHEAQGGDDNDESSGYEDAPSEFSPSPSTPDTQLGGDLVESEAEDEGSTSTLDEQGAAAVYAIQLDEFLGSAPVQYREVQYHESSIFCGYFKQGIM